MATSAEEIRRMFAEQQAHDDALAAAGFAPGEEPSPEFLAEALPERQTVFTGEAYEPYVDEPVPSVEPAPFVNPFVDAPAADPSGFVNPFTTEADQRARAAGLANPLADLQSDFPMEPGTSRASQEMGEMFVPSWLGGDAPLVGPGRTTPATGGGVGAELTQSPNINTTDIEYMLASFKLADAQTGDDPAEIEKAKKELTRAEEGGEPVSRLGKLGISAAALSMTDPEEIATMLRQYPEIGISYAPDGAIIATNNKTGARGLINRPGMSMMDMLQILGIMTAFHPAAKFASLGIKTALPGVASQTMRKALEREATKQAIRQGSAATAATQAVIEGGQATAGGTYDPEDIVFAGVAGAAGEKLIKPVAALASKAKEVFGKTVKDVAPRSVSQALEFAKASGRKVFTSDALGEFLTPVQQIAMKVIERIPFTGIGGLRRKQKGARADALIELVNKYGIDIEKELGKDIATNFITRMIKQRFWGRNADKLDPNKWPSPITKPYEHRQAKQAAQELIDRAWQKESVVAIDSGLAKALARGDLDDEIVDRILDQAKPKRVTDLFTKLMPEGKQAVKQRFLTKGLEKAGWTPDAPQIADSTKFVKYMSDPKNRKMMNIFFDKTERDLIEGTTEYLRMTAAAAATSKGAGMVAAVGGSAVVAGALYTGFLSGAALTAVAGRIVQSAPVRNLLVKLVYAKGNAEKTQAIMRQLRPAILALQSTYLESGGPPELPEVEFNKDMMKDFGDYSMEYLRNLGDVGMEKFEDVTGRLTKMLTE